VTLVHLTKKHSDEPIWVNFDQVDVFYAHPSGEGTLVDFNLEGGQSTYIVVRESPEEVALLVSRASRS
jgi:hypothetical protein